MTSTRNHALFKQLFNQLIAKTPGCLAEEYFEEAKEKNRTLEYRMVKSLLSKSFPTSGDCVKRFQLRDLKHAIMSKVHNLPRVSPYPIFLKPEKDIPYVQIPEMGHLGATAIVHRAYNKYVFNADLLSLVPISIISALDITPSLLIRDTGGNKCETLVHCTKLLNSIVEAGMLGYFMDGEEYLFKLLLESGLEGLSGFLNDENFDIQFDVCTLALVLHQANPSNTDQLKIVLREIDQGIIQEYAHILCRCKFGVYEILEQLYKDPYLDHLLIYSLLLAAGHSLSADWFTEYFDPDQLIVTLQSYSEEINEFTPAEDQNGFAFDHILFLAVCRNESDKLIMALIRRKRFYLPVGAFFLLLLAGRSEELIRYFLTSQKDTWIFLYPDNIPSNVDIPLSLLPHIIPHLGVASMLSILIPCPEKYITALQYVAEHNLWTDSFSLLRVVQWEVRACRPLVLQAVLDIATKDDFCSFALQPIFSETDVSVEMIMERLPVMEYLQMVPNPKLSEAIEKAGSQSPSILDPALPGPLNASMLPLIYRIGLIRPQLYVFFVQLNLEPICTAMVSEAWTNIFPDVPCPSWRNPTFPSNFFMLFRQIQTGNVKATFILFPMAFHSFQAVGSSDMDLNYPEDFTFRQKASVKDLLFTATSMFSKADIIQLLKALKDNIMSPFTQAAFMRLICLPNGLALIIKEEIMGSDDILHLLRTLVDAKYLSDDLLHAIQNNHIDDSTCPWLATGLKII